MTTQKKLSSARLTETTQPNVEEFTASVQFDWRMYRQDIQGSIAHAKMLAFIGVLTDDERDNIVNGLETICIEIEQGSVSMAGSTGGRAHEY